MSRSQFQSKRFILRHAWLNLWDERMTTGRINQVAILNTNARSTLKITPWTTRLQIKTARVQNFAMFPHKSRTEYRNGHNRCDLKTHRPCWSQLERTPETPTRKVHAGAKTASSNTFRAKSLHYVRNIDPKQQPQTFVQRPFEGQISPHKLIKRLSVRIACLLYTSPSPRD